MLNVPEKLEAMAQTFRERNAVYGDNYKMVPQLMKALFPDGVEPALVLEEQFHLFELILVKLSRYAISGLTHTDSIHDAAVYCAMCEAINESALMDECQGEQWPAATKPIDDKDALINHLRVQLRERSKVITQLQKAGA